MPAPLYDYEAAFRWARQQIEEDPQLPMTTFTNRAKACGIANDASRAWWHKVYSSARRAAGIYHGHAAMRTVTAKYQTVQWDELTEQEQLAWNQPGIRRLAADVLRMAWEDAGRRPSLRKDNQTYAPSLRIRYSQAWLQTPKATARYCELLDIDPDQLAELSRRRHGVPRFTADEIARLLRPDSLIP